jgi:hypothetical protein
MSRTVLLSDFIIVNIEALSFQAKLISIYRYFATFVSLFSYLTSLHISFYDTMINSCYTVVFV